MSVPQQPKVSVSLVTYNHRDFIAQSIEGVLMQQTTFPFELVIGDDCSTDGTREIITEYQYRNPGVIRLLLQPRNTRGIGSFIDNYAACRGDYIAELEGDDYWIDPLKLQSQSDLLDANPAAFLCGARAYVWKHGDPEPYAIAPPDDTRTLAAYGPREMLESKWWFRTCTKVYPRRLLQSVPPRYHVDWAETLWLIAKTDFAPICFVDRIVGVYREHPGGNWSAAHPYVRLAVDIRTLVDIIPLFAGDAQEYLRDQLRKHLAELMAVPDAPPSTLVRAAGRALRRTPADPEVWRYVRACLRRCLRAPA